MILLHPFLTNKIVTNPVRIDYPWRTEKKVYCLTFLTHMSMNYDDVLSGKFFVFFASYRGDSKYIFMVKPSNLYFMAK